MHGDALESRLVRQHEVGVKLEPAFAEAPEDSDQVFTREQRQVGHGLLVPLGGVVTVKPERVERVGLACGQSSPNGLEDLVLEDVHIEAN